MYVGVVKCVYAACQLASFCFSTEVESTRPLTWRPLFFCLAACKASSTGTNLRPNGSEIDPPALHLPWKVTIGQLLTSENSSMLVAWRFWNESSSIVECHRPPTVSLLRWSACFSLFLLSLFWCPIFPVIVVPGQRGFQFSWILAMPSSSSHVCLVVCVRAMFLQMLCCGASWIWTV